MRDSRPYLINNLFGDAAKTGRMSLSKIQQRAIMLLNLNRAVSALLPAVLRPWCRVANARQSMIVMETANASWQMRLRYEQPQLLSALREKILPSLSSINIRINPGLAITQELNMKNNDRSREYCCRPLADTPLQLSEQSAASIRYVATLSEEKLKTALERLADLSKENSKTTHHRK